jgi:hypothetical protein
MRRDGVACTADSGRYVNLPGGAPAFMRPIVGRYEKGEKLLSLS